MFTKFVPSSTRIRTAAPGFNIRRANGKVAACPRSLPDAIRDKTYHCYVDPESKQIALVPSPDGAIKVTKSPSRILGKAFESLGVKQGFYPLLRDTPPLLIEGKPTPCLLINIPNK